MRLYLRLVFCLFFFKISETQRINMATYATVPQLIAAEGYPVEKHRVVTEDGYILQLHRIPAGKGVANTSTPRNKEKKAILLLHGLLGHSGDFIIMGPKRSLAYLLADAGYDVWLGNLRSTIYSSHLNYTKNDPRYWEFSIHEHGKYDAPAMIDKVLNVTGVAKVMYIGWSMGTTTFFTMMSERPEYNDKVLNFVALAPAVYLDNVEPVATTFLKNLKITEAMKANGFVSAYTGRNFLEFLAYSICSMEHPERDLCMRIVFMLVGEDYEQCDWDMNAVIISRIQPASWRQLEHFGKIAMTGVFTSWEDGLFGKVKPYNLTNVRVPVTLFYGENDQLTPKTQVMRLARELQDAGVLESVSPACSWPKFNHLDFGFSRDVDKLFNTPFVHKVQSLFNKYMP